MHSLTPADIAALASMITLFAAFGLAASVQHQLAEPNADFPMPAAVRTAVGRGELIARPTALVAVGVGITWCLFMLRVGEAGRHDFRGVATILELLFTYMAVHALLRIALPRLWRPPRAEHLAPRLRTDELSWVIAALSVAFLFSTSLPVLVIARRPVPTLLIFLGGSLLLLLMSRALVRRSHRSTVRERRKRDRDLEDGGLRLERRVITISGCDIEIDVFDGETPGTFIDADRAQELAADVAATRSYLLARGHDSEELPNVRVRWWPRPRLSVTVPVASRNRPLAASARLARLRHLAVRRRRHARLFRLDEPCANVLLLLDALSPRADGTGRSVSRTENAGNRSAPAANLLHSEGAVVVGP